MYSTLLMIHSLLRYLILILMAAVILSTLAGWLHSSPFGKFHRLITRLNMATAHTQLLIGLGLYFSSPLVVFSGETMKNGLYRYWTVEHWILMLVAITLITFSYLRSKKGPSDRLKHRSVFLLNVAALLVILVSLVLSQRGVI
jgi:hypothetical protein